MLVRLSRAGRRGAAIWAMAFAFAFAPTLSFAFSTPAGAYTHVLVHAHDHDHAGHTHHGDGDPWHHHSDGSADERNHGDTGSSEQPDDQVPNSLHVHHDASCPSLLLPDVAAAKLVYRLVHRLGAARNEFGPGTPPDCLLRPPISLSSL